MTSSLAYRAAQACRQLLSIALIKVGTFVHPKANPASNPWHPEDIAASSEASRPHHVSTPEIQRLWKAWEDHLASGMGFHLVPISALSDSVRVDCSDGARESNLGRKA